MNDSAQLAKRATVHGSYPDGVRGVETIEAELRLLAAVWSSIRETQSCRGSRRTDRDACQIPHPGPRIGDRHPGVRHRVDNRLPGEPAASGSFRPSWLTGVSCVWCLGLCDGVYYPYMASIVGKRRGKQTYYYLVESARVDGKPRIVSQQYLGSAEEVMAKLSGVPPGRPVRSQHKRFGDLAAVWSVLERLGVAASLTRWRRATPTRRRRWAPTWRWRARTGSSTRARSGASPTGGPPRPGRGG